MSEYQNATATTETASAAVAARPRISADAFRNLTARLKKPDIVIPDLKPEILVTPAIAPIVVEPKALEIAPISIAPVAIEPAVVATAPVLAPVLIEPVLEAFSPVVVEQGVYDVVPAFSEQTNVNLVPASIEPAAENIAPAFVEQQSVELSPLSIEVLAVDPIIEIINELEIQTVDVQPLAVEAIQTEPSTVTIEPPISIVEATETVPQISVSETTIETRIIEQPPETFAFPLLPEPVIQQPVSIESEPVVAAQNGGFEENFTYLPEAGKEEKSADLAAIDEAVKQGVAERAIQLELENIWRLLLAKPTSDDRQAYLREAKEIHAHDEEWNKPEPEHDLSRIEPAQISGVTIENADVQSNFDVVIERSLADNLPVVEGQDLTELTRSLLDMMAAGNASGLPQERALAADTLLRLVPRLEMKPLLMLAQRLSMMDSPPHLLVSRLIRDPRVEIAGPLLEDCPHIGDKELEQVVQEGEPDKLRLIARRRKLSRTIGEALIKSGDPSVVLTLVRNMEAEISHDGFQSLLVLCENHEELLAPLATRQDLTAPFAFELFWLAPAQLRRFILSRFLTDSETLTKILKITMAANSEDDAEPEPLNQHTLLEALERAARGQIEVAAEELSGVMQLSVATVARILSDLQGDALVVMLKAAVYPRSSMHGLLKRMQSADLPLISRDRDLTELQSMFETLSFNKARILLTYWDWAQSKTGPYAAPH